MADEVRLIDANALRVQDGRVTAMTKKEYEEELEKKLVQAYGIMGHNGHYDKKDELLFKIIQLLIMKEQYELEKGDSE